MHTHKSAVAIVAEATPCPAVQIIFPVVIVDQNIDTMRAAVQIAAKASVQNESSTHVLNSPRLTADLGLQQSNIALQIEFPVAIVDKNIDRKKPATRKAAEAFIQYLFTTPAQQEFMDCGFRSGHCDTFPVFGYESMIKLGLYGHVV